MLQLGGVVWSVRLPSSSHAVTASQPRREADTSLLRRAADISLSRRATAAASERCWAPVSGKLPTPTSLHSPKQ